MDRRVLFSVGSRVDVEIELSVRMMRMLPLMRRSGLVAVLTLSIICYQESFCDALLPRSNRQQSPRGQVALSAEDAWNGEVVPNEGGNIRGCSLLLKDGTLTDWEVKIDGVEADLGGFSKAIYQKIAKDATRQQFQGFRPGTIPPHLEPTYRAYAMDECARETVLEALLQNNVRPFEQTRNELVIEQVMIPPPTPKKSKKKKKKRKKSADTTAAAVVTEPEEAPKEWIMYENMKSAIDAGWRPGQSFSFVATNVKGQKVKDTTEATPLNF